MDLVLFKEQFVVEKKLYGESPVFEYIEIQKMDFLVNIFSIYPKLRPLHLEKFVFFCSYYLKDSYMRKIVLEKVFIVCPTLIQRLYRINGFTKEEIQESLEFHRSKFLCLFFKNDIEVDYSGFSESDAQYSDDTELDSLIQFGFLKSSIEFCLKYDLFEEIDKRMINNHNKRECEWSPFEWSEEPKSLDFLSFSGFFGSLKCFKVLLLSGFVINDQVVCSVVCSSSMGLFNLVFHQYKTNISLLHEASRFFNLSIIEYLVNHKADVNAKNDDDYAPLHYAAREGHLSVVKYLVNQKADLNSKNDDDYTPLHYAASNGHLSIVEYLVGQKARINANDRYNWTPLHYAAQQSHLNVVEYLVGQKAAINAKNNNGWTPLHLAAQNGHLSVVEYLINQKADINAKGHNNQIPLHLAASYGYLSVVEYLVNQKADINYKSKSVEFLY